MDPQTPPPSFWPDKRARWIERARRFRQAEAVSACAALNDHISASAGPLSQKRVSLEQDDAGIYAWTKSSLQLLRSMGEDVSILDDIGRTAPIKSPVKGDLPPPIPDVSSLAHYRSMISWRAEGGMPVSPALVSVLDKAAWGDGVRVADGSPPFPTLPPYPHACSDSDRAVFGGGSGESADMAAGVQRLRIRGPSLPDCLPHGTPLLAPL